MLLNPLYRFSLAVVRDICTTRREEAKHNKKIITPGHRVRIQAVDVDTTILLLRDLPSRYMGRARYCLDHFLLRLETRRGSGSAELSSDETCGTFRRIDLLHASTTLAQGHESSFQMFASCSCARHQASFSSLTSRRCLSLLGMSHKL